MGFQFWVKSIVGFLFTLSILIMPSSSYGRARPQVIKYELEVLRGSNSFGGNAMIINNKGVIAGGMDTSSRLRHAMIFLNGLFVDIDPNFNGNSEVWGINSKNYTVGLRQLNSRNNEAVLWSPEGLAIVLGTLGGPSAQALDINNSFQIVGSSQYDYHNRTGFYWEDGEMTILPSYSGKLGTFAWAINEKGEATGHAGTGKGYFPATVWLNKNSRPIALKTLGGYIGEGYDINDRGDVAGFSTSDKDSVVSYESGANVVSNESAVGGFLATVWIKSGDRPYSSTLPINLGLLKETFTSQATSINNKREVVGGSDDYAFYWNPSFKKMIDLNEHTVNLTSGHRLVRANGINDHSIIVGYGWFGRGSYEPFRLIPVR